VGLGGNPGTLVNEHLFGLIIERGSIGRQALVWNYTNLVMMT
jgi:hypothetical protein